MQYIDSLSFVGLIFFSMAVSLILIASAFIAIPIVSYIVKDIRESVILIDAVINLNRIEKRIAELDIILNSDNPWTIEIEMEYLSYKGAYGYYLMRT
jgi:hypothetical protein